MNPSRRKLLAKRNRLAQSTGSTTVRRYYQLVDVGEVVAICALFAEEATYRRPGFPLLRGHDDIRRFFSESRLIASGRHELTRIAAVGDLVAVEGNFAGLLKDGRHAAVRFADFWEFGSDGLVLSRVTYFDAPSV